MMPPKLPAPSLSPIVNVAEGAELFVTIQRDRVVPEDPRPLIVALTPFRSSVELLDGLLLLITTLPVSRPCGSALTPPSLTVPWLIIVSPVQSLLELVRVRTSVPLEGLTTTRSVGTSFPLVFAIDAQPTLV